MLLDSLVSLPDDMLTKVDRATMAASLEARVPLLDHRLVEMGWRLPPHAKIRDGQGKWILRSILDRYVPRSLTERPKMGFDPPLSEWLRGPLRPWAEEQLSTAALEASGLLEAAPIRRAWESHLAGRTNEDYRLWHVLMLQSWLDANRSPASSGPAAAGERR